MYHHQHCYMATETRTRNTLQSYPVNPFVATGMKEKCRRSDSGETELVNTRTGEYYALRPIQSVAVLVDSATYAKVFHEGLNRLLAEDLSLSALKLCLYIIRELKPRKDHIEIDIETCLTACKWKSVSVFNSSARELINKDFIKKSTKGKTVYWINTNWFFNGNRLLLHKAQTA